MKLIVNKTHSTMQNEGEILELLTEALKGQADVIEIEMSSMDNRLENFESRTSRIEDQVIKPNFQTVENTRAIFKLAEKVEQIADLSNRVTKLEKVVYK